MFSYPSKYLFWVLAKENFWVPTTYVLVENKKNMFIKHYQIATIAIKILSFY